MIFINIIDLIQWLLLYFLPSIRKKFFLEFHLDLDNYLQHNQTSETKFNKINKYLNENHIYNLNDHFKKNFLNDFLLNYLGNDGIFLFKLIYMNFGEVITKHLLHEIVFKYIELKLEINSNSYNKCHLITPNLTFI